MIQAVVPKGRAKRRLNRKQINGPWKAKCLKGQWAFDEQNGLAPLNKALHKISKVVLLVTATSASSVEKCQPKLHASINDGYDRIIGKLILDTFSV